MKKYYYGIFATLLNIIMGFLIPYLPIDKKIMFCLFIGNVFCFLLIGIYFGICKFIDFIKNTTNNTSR